MKVTVQDIGPCRKSLNIEIPVDSIDTEYRQVLGLYRKSAKIPGFRPGKAPEKLVQNRYAKKIQEEVKDRLIPQGYRDAIQQEKLDVVAVLGVEDVNFSTGVPMRFSVTLDIPPEFKLPSYKKFSLKENKTDIKDKDIDETLETLREQYGTFQDVEERGVQKDDVVKIDYEGVMDGIPISKTVTSDEAIGKGKDFWCRIEENSFVPGMDRGLLNTKIGEKKEIEIAFPEDFKVEVVAGKKAVYSVEVKAIREKKKSDLNEEFFKPFNVASEEELKTRIREDLTRAAQDKEKERLKNEIIKDLLQKTKLDLPESLVIQETRNLIESMVNQNAKRGLSQKVIEENKDQIFESANRNAKDTVKLHYILHRIADKEKIEVSENELNQYIAAMASYYGSDPSTFKTELESKNIIDTIKIDLRNNRTVDFLIENFVKH
ncbi:MAG: trigger factor [Kiritimatiellae bacterium]|nr:trigger factor [Kiritimatiellia bacterium]